MGDQWSRRSRHCGQTGVICFSAAVFGTSYGKTRGLWHRQRGGSRFQLRITIRTAPESVRQTVHAQLPQSPSSIICPGQGIEHQLGGRQGNWCKATLTNRVYHKSYQKTILKKTNPEGFWDLLWVFGARIAGVAVR